MLDRDTQTELWNWKKGSKEKRERARRKIISRLIAHKAKIVARASVSTRLHRPNDGEV